MQEAQEEEEVGGWIVIVNDIAMNCIRFTYLSLAFTYSIYHTYVPVFGYML